MNRIKELDRSAFGVASSPSDQNKLYSMLLDTKVSSESDNMYDISEKILSNEKNNAKFALEQLWALKKNLNDEAENSTVDILITFYQDKLNIVRNKEEYIKKISKDSRELLEKKRAHDGQVANVKQELTECSSEIDKLTAKINQHFKNFKLIKVKEKELELIGTQFEKDIQLNANKVVNGLYEIILIGRGNDDNRFSPDKELATSNNSRSAAQSENEPEKDMASGKSGLLEDDGGGNVYDVLAREMLFETKDELIFPKSVVKSTKGGVIGEYYYDSSISKEKRFYIFNSRFFSNCLEKNINTLNTAFDEDLYAETLQMVQDGYRRVRESKNIFFEVSTKEILNTKTLKEMWKNLSQKDYDEVLKLSLRIKEKILNLGSNYSTILKEQMESCCAFSKSVP